MAKTYSRSELYDLVWLEPMKSVAARAGVSDVALAKACRKAGIPIPERGYWAKLKAGKLVHRPPLPLRFPGASNQVVVGGDQWRAISKPLSLDDPLPPPPSFDEGMEVLTERVRRMVKKVQCPPLTNPHPLIAKLLAHDEERRSKRSMWDRPKFENPEERRRLRILNALFLAAEKTGCAPLMSTSKHAVIREASIQVGDQNVAFALTPLFGGARAVLSGSRQRLQLTIASRQYGVANMGAWQDSDTAKLEDQLTDILNRIIVVAETFYRTKSVEYYEWRIQRRAEMEEELRRTQEEEARKARELREMRERERIDSLFAQADAMHKAAAIRAYVDAVLARRTDIAADPMAVEQWAEWARSQADRIDPVLNWASMSGDLGGASVLQACVAEMAPPE